MLSIVHLADQPLWITFRLFLSIRIILLEDRHAGNWKSRNWKQEVDRAYQHQFHRNRYDE